jgi:quercetin dioxygenase-like cupin family protein
MRSAIAFRSIVAAALFGAFSGVAWAEGAHKVMPAKDLAWRDEPGLPPGAKTVVIEGPLDKAVPFTLRVKFPANYRLPSHMHPAIERLTVLSGTFYMGMGDQLDPARATMALGAGDVIIMDPNVRHFAVTKEETVLQLHGTGPWGITYVNPADDPRTK